MKRRNLFWFIVLLISLVFSLSGCSPSNKAPTANFTADPTSGTAPLEISFDASGSTDPDGSVISYSWDFGDGGESTAKVTSHTYESGGEYTAELTVTDDGGAKSTKDITITVLPGNQPPTASFTMSGTSGSAPFYVNFDASGSNDPDGTIESYHWNLDDDGATGSGITYTYTYNYSGEYDVELTVTDNEGATTTASTTLTLPLSTESNQSPVASFMASQYSGEAPLDIYFDASYSNDPDGTITSYQWDFDDGTRAKGETVEHTFDNSKLSYDVRLTITDDEGAKSSVINSIKINPPTPSAKEK